MESWSLSSIISSDATGGVRRLPASHSTVLNCRYRASGGPSFVPDCPWANPRLPTPSVLRPA
jgi:hypothetical protein